MSRREQEKNQAQAKQKILDREQKLLLEFALAQKKDFLQTYLHKKGLASSGNKDVLRERILKHIRDYALSYDEIAQFLDTVEGWGDQSIYLYTAPAGMMDLWRQRSETLTNKLAHNNLSKLINAKKPVLLPEKPELTTIKLDKDSIQFVWVEKHEWYQRDTALDNNDNLNYELRGFRRRLERRITRFECDIRNGNCMLAIPSIGANRLVGSDGNQLTSNSSYQKIREDFERILEPVINISTYSKFALTSVIAVLETNAEVRRKENVFETPEGTHIKVLSTIANKDINSDHRTQLVRNVIPEDSPGLNGNYKWLAKDPELLRDISVKLYGSEQRISIGAQCDEKEVRYVISRIRHFGQ